MKRHRRQNPLSGGEMIVGLGLLGAIGTAIYLATKKSNSTTTSTKTVPITYPIFPIAPPPFTPPPPAPLPPPQVPQPTTVTLVPGSQTVSVPANLGVIITLPPNAQWGSGGSTPWTIKPQDIPLWNTRSLVVTENWLQYNQAQSSYTPQSTTLTLNVT